MLSQVVKRGMLRASRPVLTKNLGVDRPKVCFCGCKDGKHFGRPSMLQNIVRRNFSSFHDKLNVNDATNLIPAEYKPADQVAMWKD